ncbi:hypothetical protein DPMN_005006 [Dreissena polymorpha]|uniref:Uncharacterized protein n=1 Tax=Dreissena polymorpha TaxID=45954 RepID=A0A9D4MTQ5_DREPO|nr:hypothetical protein DPMN_005006 [Dreissena polymorpha]
MTVTHNQHSPHGLHWTNAEQIRIAPDKHGPTRHLHGPTIPDLHDNATDKQSSDTEQTRFAPDRQ